MTCSLVSTKRGPVGCLQLWLIVIGLGEGWVLILRGSPEHLHVGGNCHFGGDLKHVWSPCHLFY